MFEHEEMIGVETSLLFSFKIRLNTTEYTNISENLICQYCKLAFENIYIIIH